MIQTIVAQPGTTLFQIAAQYLGDARQWSRIALINGIEDPFLSASTTLTLPTILTPRGQGRAGQS
jgi:nucleoid-associated protein YgaU